MNDEPECHQFFSCTHIDEKPKPLFKVVKHENNESELKNEEIQR